MAERQVPIAQQIRELQQRTDALERGVAETGKRIEELHVAMFGEAMLATATPASAYRDTSTTGMHGEGVGNACAVPKEVMDGRARIAGRDVQWDSAMEEWRDAMERGRDLESRLEALAKPRRPRSRHKPAPDTNTKRTRKPRVRR